MILKVAKIDTTDIHDKIIPPKANKIGEKLHFPKYGEGAAAASN